MIAESVAVKRPFRLRLEAPICEGVGDGRLWR